MLLVRRARVLVVALVAAVAASVVTIVPDSRPAGAATPSLKEGPRFEHVYTEFDRTNATTELFSAAAVGNVAGDAQPEIVAGGNDGVVRIWTTSGELVWAYKVGAGAIQASPTLVDVNRDGLLDVLTAAMSGQVEIFTGNGQRLFKVQISNDPMHPGVFGTPTAADIDRDGQLEVIVGSYDTRIHAWNLDGSYVPGFPVWVYDSVWSSPAVADLDNDGWLEIIVGGDMDEYPGAPYPRGGLIWVIRHDGSHQPGFPVELHDQVVWSSPAVVDISGDGRLDIVVGTGLFWNEPDGRRVFAIDSAGNFLPGWPVPVGGRVMASPAIGDLTGDGRPEVVTMAEDGRVYAHTGSGALLWKACVVSNTSACRDGYGVHGQVSLADVDNDGVVEVITSAEHFMRILDGRNGAEEASALMPAVWAPGAAPTVAQIGGEAWILVNSVVNTRDDGDRKVGDTHKVWAWKTGQPVGAAPWPTFKQNMRRSGTVLDLTPPTASMGSLDSTQATTEVKVSWSGSDTGGSGLRRFHIDVNTDGQGWVRWMSTPRTSATLWAIPGSTYRFRVHASDWAGNASPRSAEVSTTVPSSATRVQPITAAYAVSSSGGVSTLSSPPVKGHSFPAGIGRSITLRADGRGGYILDGWGGLHAFGNAPPVTGPGYWPGWDIARGIGVNADGASGYKLDGWGGLHPFGGAGRVANGPYFPGADIARDLVLLPTSTKTDPAGYVLDAYGGVHAFGSAPVLSGSGRRWPFAIARAFTLNPEGPGGWVLDGWGALHSVGGAPKPPVRSYWPGWDITRDAVAVTASSGYVLDGFGGIHPWGSIAKPAVGTYWGRDVARALTVVP